jgi:hypothetical protein
MHTAVSNASTAEQPIPTSRLQRAGSVLLREFRHLLPVALFFFIGFNLILFTKQLVLEQYLIQFSGFMVATVGALVVAKVVLVADMLPLLRRFDTAPLIQPILFKTVVYTLLVFVARLLEAFVEFMLGGGAASNFVHHIIAEFSWPRFISTQIWIFVLFLLYTTASELNHVFGDGELHKILFTRRSSELKLTRRQRIRELVRLSRLTDRHALDEFSDPQSPAHTELKALIGRLAHRAP